MSVTGEAEDCFLTIRGDGTKKRPHSSTRTQPRFQEAETGRKRERPAGRAGAFSAPLSATKIISREKSLRTQRK